MAQPGYTLPVFAVAAAKGALLHLLQSTPVRTVTLDLLQPPEQVTIPIDQVAQVGPVSALAITYSDPGDHLDLTRHTPVWAWIELQPLGESDSTLIIEAGAGLGQRVDGTPAIYQYAYALFEAELKPLIPPASRVTVQIILPEGKQLAARTSNAAFGIVEGLSLVGTTGLVQPMSATDYLDQSRSQLQACLQTQTELVFCIGEHGRQVALRLGVPAAQIIQTANWIGPLLVEAGLRGATSIVLVGYQGKLLKLAGGIFNTSSHVADARLEILVAALIRRYPNPELAQTLLQSTTADAAYQRLVQVGWAEAIFTDLAEQICCRAQQYVSKYADRQVNIGVVLFDRQGQIIVQQSPVLDPENRTSRTDDSH